MSKVLTRGSHCFVVVCMFVITVAGLVPISSAQAPSQASGVDNTPMGPYRALAQLSFQAFQKGDSATAAELARILERTWDAAEGGGGERSLGKINKDLFGQIDEAMDVFIKPVLHYSAKSPDPAAVQTAYNAFLDKLKQGDK